MFARIRRMFRAAVGSVISNTESPRAALEQSIRDMKAKVPEMNKALAKARAGTVRLKNEAAEFQKRATETVSKIKTSLSAGKEEVAAKLSVQLNQLREAIKLNEEQQKSAKVHYEKLVDMKKKFMVEMKRKTEEAVQVLRSSEAAEWKSELASTYQSFEVGDVGDTHDEMIKKMQDENAMAEAKLAMTDSPQKNAEAERDKKFMELEGKELLNQFKQEMGLAGKGDAPAATPGGPSTDGPGESAAKTIGPAVVPSGSESDSAESTSDGKQPQDAEDPPVKKTIGPETFHTGSKDSSEDDKA